MPGTMFKTSSLLFVFFIASRLLGFVREQIVAAYLGATPQSDAYVVASTIPFILSYIIGNAAGNSFLPVFTGRIGQVDAGRLISTVFFIFGIFVTLIALSGFLFAPGLVDLLAPGFTSGVRDLAVQCTRIMIPGLVFLTLGYLVKAALNACRHFTVPAAAPALQNVAFIALLFVLAQKGAVGLAWCMLAGTVVFYIVQRLVLTKYGYPFKLQIDLRDPDVKRVFVLAVPVLFTVLGTKGYIFLDRWLGSQLSGGSIAALNFADRIRELPYGLFVAVVSTVLFPSLASAAGRLDFHSLRRTTAKGLRLVALLGFPSAILLVLLDFPVVRLLFERGAFDVAATTATAGALEFYALSVVALSANSIITYTFFSLQDGMIPLKVGLASLVLNLVLDLLLVGPLGHVGLAVGNTLAAYFAMFILLFLVTRKLNGFDWYGLLGSVGKIALAAIIFGCVVAGVANYTGLGGNEVTLAGQLAGFAAVLGLGGVVYLLLLYVLRVEDIRRPLH